MCLPLKSFWSDVKPPLLTVYDLCPFFADVATSTHIVL